MIASRRVRLLWAVALVTAEVACGGSGGSSSSGGSASGPTTPTPTPTGSTSCRTYPTRANVHTTTTSSSIVFDALEIASFDSSTKKSTVQTNFATGAACSTNVTSYNSVADFVDEVRVIPPISLATGAVNTNSGSCGTGTATTGYVYDSQRRLTQITNGSTGVTTYTAWDSSGRPTKGTTSGSTISLVYDDASRSWTSTQTASNGSVATGTLTFDANGAQVSNVVVQGGVTSTTTFTNTATATVCK